jgi:glycosyltransferase involved in cell wall biosynthesis
MDATRLRNLGPFLSKVLIIARKHGVVGALTVVLRHIGSPTRSATVPGGVLDVVTPVSLGQSESEKVARVGTLATPTSKVLILDGAIGGGAGMFGWSIGSRLAGAGVEVTALQYDGGSSRFVLTQHGAGHVDVQSAVPATRGLNTSATARALEDVISRTQPDAVLVNHLITWPCLARVLHTIENSSVPYTYLLHDFFPVCPNWQLIAQDGAYCGLACHERYPDCVLRNRNTSWEYYYRRKDLDSLQHWRVLWSQFLARSKAVVAFSESSRELLQQAYPSVVNRITVQPHAVLQAESFPWAQRGGFRDGQLRIAVIGYMDVVKGWLRVKSICRSLSDWRVDAQLFLYGNTPEWDLEIPRSLVCRGPYERSALHERLLADSVDAVLIPSVWPETFSFTTAEAMCMGYPVICFNLGNPAALVSATGGGWVVDPNQPDALMRLLAHLCRAPGEVRAASLRTQYLKLPSEAEQTLRLAETILNDCAPSTPSCAGA